MDPLSFITVPTLNRPMLVLAFAGWNDAGVSATFAAKFLSQRLGAHKFASLDPETLYNFVEQRPQVRLRKASVKSSGQPMSFPTRAMRASCKM